MTADKRLIIVRHSSRTHKIVQYLRKAGFGLFLILLFVGVFSYTRAGVYTRTHTREVVAATSSNLNFQGRLFSVAGNVVSDGSYSIQFNLYNVAIGGTTQWTETQATVQVRNGYFSVQLGSVTPFPGTIDWTQEQWLTMNVNGDGEMTPRLKLTAVPYAFRAGQADGITNGSGVLTADDILQKAPVTIQSLNSANSGLRFNQVGSGGLIQLQGDGSDVFTIAKSGNILTTGNVDINGSTLDVGTTALAGLITLSDGSSSTGQLQVASLGANRTYTFSDNSGVVLLDSTGFAQNGNSFGGAAVLGTNDSNNLSFETGGTTRLTIDTSGNVKIGAGTATENLDLDGALRLGTTSNSNAGTIRWTGTDFEGYDGTSWLSFTDDYTGTPTININKTANEQVNNNTVQPDDELTFPIAANETWTYRFVVQANSPAAADIRFTLNGPAGATCVTGVSNAEDTVTVANLACGATSGQLNTLGTADLFEITGTIVNGANAGNVSLSWGQFTTSGTTTVYAGSYVTAMRVSGTVSGLEFMNGGNSFGGLAELGTNDNFGLDIQTNGAARISIANTGEITLNSLTDATNGLIISGGDLDLNGTESITNIGNGLTGSGALTLASGGSGDLILDSASGILVLSDATWRRVAAGSTTIDLNDSSDTTLSIVNSDGGALANLSVEGDVSATTFTGNGSGLTTLNAGNISTGTLDSARLDTNVARLNVNQTFSARPTFSDGLILGNSASVSAGALRWSGTDFEGYDGIQWVSLTGGGGGGGPTGPGTVSVIKAADEVINTNNTPQDDDDLTFEIGANEDWTFRFVVQATSPTAADIQFAVSAPSGATCDVSVVEHENATSIADLGCGVVSGIIVANDVPDTYEIIGSIRNGANPGDVTLQWSQFVSDPGNTTVLEGSFLSASVEGGGLQFFQNGNGFGQTAILGTTDNFGLNFITNNATALALATNGDATFTGLALLSGGATIGNAASDSFTITSDAVSLPNGLNFDSNTLVIDSANNRIGIGDASPGSKLSVNDAATNDSDAQALIYTGGTGNKALVLQRFAGQTANLFEIQNESGQTLTFFNKDGELGLGRGTTFDGALIFNNATNSNTLRLVTGTATSNKTLTLPDETGTICVADSVNCGFIKFAEASAQVDSSTDTSLFINKTGASGDILNLQKNGSGVFTIANGGATQISSDSTTALQIRNSAGSSNFFTVDTSGAIVQIGSSTGDATGVLFVLDSKTGSDPTGVAGAQYYNSTDNKFRCYENGAWVDCNTTPVSGETTLGSAANTITVTLSQSYEYLHCRLDTKGATGAAGIYMRFNGDSGAASYGWNTYSIVGTAVQDAQDSSDSELQLIGTNTTTVPSSFDINITNFTDTRKTVDWSMAGSSTIGTNMLRFSGGGTWDNTATGISSVTFLTSANSFSAGTHAWCEGRDVR